MQRYNLYLRYKSNFILFRLNIPTSWITNIPLPLFPGCYVEEQHTPARHPARDAGSSSWHKRNNNGDSLPQIFLDTASRTVSPRTAMRGPERGRKGSVFCKCFCRYFLDSTSMCGMTKAGSPGSRIGVRNDQMTASLCDMSRARSPVRPMGESGKKNDGVGRTREKDV